MTLGDGAAAGASQSREDEFSAFYRANYQSALQLIRFRISGGDAEALLADCFLVAWQHFSRTGELWRGWFFGVVRNKIGDFYRAGQRREMLVDDWDPHESIHDPSANQVVSLDVWRTLRRLPSQHCEPLLLAFWCDLSSAEAAQALGIRESTLRVRLHRAKRAFLSEYEPGAAQATGESGKGVAAWIAQND